MEPNGSQRALHEKTNDWQRLCLLGELNYCPCSELWCLRKQKQKICGVGAHNKPLRAGLLSIPIFDWVCCPQVIP